MNWTDVGNRISERRNALGLTMKDASERSGVSIPVWDVIENARRERYRSKTLRQIEATLGWPSGGIDALLRGEEIYEEAPRAQRHISVSDAERNTQIMSLLGTLDDGDLSVIARLVVDMAASSLLGDTWQAELVRGLFEFGDETEFIDVKLRQRIQDSLGQGEFDDVRAGIIDIIDTELSAYEDAMSAEHDPSDHLADDEDDLPVAAERDAREGDNVRHLRPAPEGGDDFDTP